MFNLRRTWLRALRARATLRRRPAAERLEDRTLLAVIINEILFDPAMGPAGDANGDGERHDDLDEFVEIVNTGPGSVDISDWSIDDDETLGGRFRFPPGTVLAENEAAVLFGGGMPTGSFGGAQVFTDDGTIGNQLANSGDLVVLLNAADVRFIRQIGVVS